jgi:septal ring factor EnvC (AmiA/AmiB activator)
VTQEFQWLIGIAITVVLSIGGIAVAAFRSMSTKLDEAMADMRKGIKQGEDALHDRVNRLRQDMSDNFVRRADLESHMKRLDDTTKEIRDDQKQIIRQLATLEAKQPK